MLVSGRELAIGLGEERVRLGLGAGCNPIRGYSTEFTGPLAARSWSYMSHSIREPLHNRLL